jgi:transposase-like protein
MGVTLKELLGLAKDLPEEALNEAYEKLKEVKEKAEAEKDSAPVTCMRCGSEKIVKNGKQSGR